MDTATLPPKQKPQPKAENSDERKIPLEEIVGIPDFEEAARRNMTDKAWAYISAGATDMHCEWRMLERCCEIGGRVAFVLLSCLVLASPLR